MQQFPLPPLDLLRWLNAQNHYPKFYWKERDGHEEIAAVGTLLTLDKLPLCEAPNVRFYGGKAFGRGKRKDSVWEKFPDAYFFLPAFEIRQTPEKTTLFINQHEGKSFDGQSLLFDCAPLTQSLLAPIDRLNMPAFTQWQESIAGILEEISAGELGKIVLARRSTLEFDQQINPWAILHALKENAVRTTLFALQISPEEAFIGASPEKLYIREGEVLKSDVTAGTRPRGRSPLEEELFCRELVRSPKEQREFASVKEFIQTVLSPYCSTIAVGKDEIYATTAVQHLHASILGQLKLSVSDRDLLKALHPTPATGGFPRKKALEKIDEMEPFERGWYAAPLGWIEAGRANFCVGIRSALVQEKRMHLFSGTGIVAGSDPHKEWEELEHKISPYLRLFS